MNYADAINSLKNGTRDAPEEINCLSHKGNTFHFDFKPHETSILSEVSVNPLDLRHIQIFTFFSGT